MRFNQGMRSTERNGPLAPIPAPGPGVLPRTLAVLEAFDPSSLVLGVSEIARRSGLPKSTVHRLLTDLVAERLIVKVRDPTTQTTAYQLGLRLFELGERVPQHFSLSQLALPIMEDLREATRQRIHLEVLDGTGTEDLDIYDIDPVEDRGRGRGHDIAACTGKALGERADVGADAAAGRAEDKQDAAHPARLRSRQRARRSRSRSRSPSPMAVSYTHLRDHETVLDLVCRLLLEKKTKNHISYAIPLLHLFLSHQSYLSTSSRFTSHQS